MASIDRFHDSPLSKSKGLPTCHYYTYNIHRRGFFSAMTQNAIDELGLSKRSYNILRRNGIATVQDLRKHWDLIPSLHGMGVTTQDEITSRLEDWTKRSPDQTPIVPLLKPQVTETDPYMVLDQPLAMLGLSRQVVIFGARNIFTIRDLLLQIDGIYSMKICGGRSRDEILEKLRTWLAKHNLSTDITSYTPDKLRKISPTDHSVVDEPTPLLSREEHQPSLESNLDLSAAGVFFQPQLEPSHETIPNAPLRVLDLSVRSYNALARKNIETVNSLIACLENLDQVPNIGEKAMTEIRLKLEAWREHPIFENDPSSSTLPSSEPARFGIVDILQGFKERDFKILALMYALYTDEPATLQKVADATGITRERVRQIIQKNFRKIHGCLPVGKNLDLALEIQDHLQQRNGVLSEIRLVKMLAEQDGYDGMKPAGLLRLLRELGLQDIFPRLRYDQDYACWFLGSLDQHLVEAALSAIQDILNQSDVPLEWNAIVDSLHLREGLYSLPSDLALALALCLKDAELIQQTPEGAWMTPRRVTRQQRLMVVLRKIGRPAHFTEIAKCYNEGHPERPMSTNSVHAVLTNPDYGFVLTGRGIYGLSEWGLHDDGTLANAVWRVLSKAGAPLNLKYIYGRVLKTWQVSEGAILSAIDHDSRFHRIDGKVKLTDFGIQKPKVAKRSDPTCTDRLVHILRSLGSPSSYQTIADEHNETYPSTPITKTRVSQVLLTSPKWFIRYAPGVFGLLEWDNSFSSPIPYERLKRQRSSSSKPARLNKINVDHIYQVLLRLGHPEHYAKINVEAGNLFPNVKFKPSSVYGMLDRHKDRFLRFAPGIYGLVEWNLTTAQYIANFLYNELSQIKEGPYSRGFAFHDLYPRYLNFSDIEIIDAIRTDPRFTFIDGIEALVEWGNAVKIVEFWDTI